MKKQKLNCEKARKISIVKTLGKFGYYPKKESEKEAWFFSPFRSETQTSFKVSKVLNSWYDHGEGVGGNVIDLVVKLKNCSVSEALGVLNNSTIPFSFHQQSPKKIKVPKTYKIDVIKNIENIELIGYLKSRKISVELARKNCVEIHYTVASRKYFSIGFKNESNGYEIRNKYSKGALGKKDVTLINNQSKTINVFEGFFDFLSYLEMYYSEKIEDFLILNSTSNAEKSVSLLKSYHHINLFLDNDEAGKRTVAFFSEKIPINDCSRLYKNYNDLNDFLCRID